jgi:hypothetical protein
MLRRCRSSRFPVLPVSAMLVLGRVEGKPACSRKRSVSVSDGHRYLQNRRDACAVEFRCPEDFKISSAFFARSGRPRRRAIMFSRDSFSPKSNGPICRRFLPALNATARSRGWNITSQASCRSVEIHADAHQALNAAGHRLTRNARLHRELAQGAGDGTLPFRPEILTDFIALAVRGLLFYHWDARLGPEHGVRVIYPTQAAEEAFELYVRGNPKRRVDENLGNGTFRYVGLQVPDYDQLSLWKMWIYGGVKLSGDQSDETVRLQSSY